MHNNIKHRGIVDSVSEGKVVVRVTQTSACSSCQMSKRCHSAEGRDKLIEVPVDDVNSYRVGEEVLVCTNARTGHYAVLLSFGLPLVLLVGVIVFVHVVNGDDAVAALCGLAALIPYFITLRILRRKVQRRVSFQLEKADGVDDDTNHKRIQESL